MRLASAIIAAAVLLLAMPARAADEEADLFARGNAALGDGRAGEAIADFEALADRGVVDPAVSLDRGLAYADRVRVGGEQPGDLGRAAHGFEEARSLAADCSRPECDAIARDATAALPIVRAEIARRRARAGDPVEVDEGASLGESIVHLASEDLWAALAAAASLLTGAGLFLRSATSKRRARVGATATVAVAGPLLVVFAGVLFAAREDRLHRVDGVVVSPSARPADARGIALPNKSSIPEGARVRVLGNNGGWVEVRWGGSDVWLPTTAVRPLAKAE